jgi:hypothetical protein
MAKHRALEPHITPSAYFTPSLTIAGCMLVPVLLNLKKTLYLKSYVNMKPRGTVRKAYKMIPPVPCVIPAVPCVLPPVPCVIPLYPV